MTRVSVSPTILLLLHVNRAEKASSSSSILFQNHFQKFDHELVIEAGARGQQPETTLGYVKRLSQKLKMGCDGSWH